MSGCGGTACFDTGKCLTVGEMHAKIGHASNHSCLLIKLQIIYTPKYWNQPYTPRKSSPS